MSNKIFQSVVGSKKRYNNFPLGHEVLTSGQIGKLIPVQCDEVVPGDRFKQSAAFLCRFSPLSAPAMARFNVHFHSFYVPYRIITPESSRESTYEKFMKSIGKPQEDVPILPYMYSVNNTDNFKNRFSVGSLADYFGYPTNIKAMPQKDRITVLPFLAYQRIYQDFYRRDQIEQEVVFPSNLEQVKLDLADGIYLSLDTDDYDLDDNQVPAKLRDLFKLQTRNYERDYFTSALPEPQFGDEVAVGDGNIDWLTMSSPLDIGVNFNGLISQFGAGAQAPAVGMVPETSATPDEEIPYYLSSSLNEGSWNLQGTTPFTNEMGEALANNLRGNSFTINEFRLAMQLQGIKEKINRVGTRYLEIMQGIYGVRVPDARLQRPVYLGGFKNPVTIGSVMQTSESNKTPQGTLTGQMSASGSNNLCNGGYMFLEHGYLITIMSITPRTSYFGGMPKKFTKKYPEDFYLPDFDHLGEQEIKKGELLYTGTDVDDETFGYTPRYAELKSSFSTVHGEFRTTLENWHVSRDFDESPSLNSSFIKAEPEDFDRIFAFQDVEGTSNEHFQMQIYIDIVAKRNMSKYSTPYTLY